MRFPKRTRVPWLESDDLRLHAYKTTMDMKWKDIFECFPDRTPAAVRTRWHMLRGKHPSLHLCRRRGNDDARIDGSAARYDHVASVHGEIEEPYFPSNRPRSSDSFSVRKRKRYEDMDTRFEADAEAAPIAVGSGWLEDGIITDMTPDANATDAQHPNSCVFGGLRHHSKNRSSLAGRWTKRRAG
ncbi:hypothetical protein BU26DRAFT_578830 [Trematosphaeria pertusa]|uniref:Myb-like domain-containing protein n=1 Tax=Trematosphaeria pertusa TaxID=390896 RepID=A0A6A6I6H3_9PLEO|nr:uncharacterized protein BU26DRAFT_578830 [Trematosphaeria pertusa]KAF2245133.1 hypothetical protein BU26DRAFT_578830 [Trematosphaeria pertusa]